MTRRSPTDRLLLLVAAALLAGAVAMGCGRNQPLTTSPETDTQTSGAVLKRGLPEVEAAVRVQERHTPELMAMAGVVGTAVGRGPDGQPAVLVLTETALPKGRLPEFLDGMRVVQEVTGRIVAFKGGGGGVSHTAKQTPPIQLGTSGGPALDLANGYCCGGTLGSLVQIGGTQYILSNSHVFAGDVVSGGNGRVSTIGDDITQPGLIDVGCNAANAQVVADLSSLSTLYPPASTPNIDAAIAQVRSGMVRTDGAILEIGTLSASTVAAAVGQAVKKSGRTTGLTRSSVSGLNATVNVNYSTECAGTSFTKTFTGQILVSNRRSGFLNSGDSGSLMVEDVTTNPRAIGLLFAGSSTIAVANPINAVLSHFGASMVGN
uniref:Nal1 C-terminal domain-containing protein n=1 Tax=Eiseniibacteriota bacterium TaxID=2212470 RepID=A0A832I2L6_UNCEI